jgi:BASS family bile acid:Na+ symporter
MKVFSRDTILVGVMFFSITAAVVFPGFASWFQSCPLYAMTVLLFMSFLTIPVYEVRQTLKNSPGYVVLLLLIKLLVLPTAMFFLFHWVLPSHALAALLLSGISTAVVSPFFAELLTANSPLVVVLVVISSLLVPVTLPALVKILAGQTMAISFTAMAQLLGAVVLIPFVVAQGTKRWAERAAKKIAEWQFPLSLMLMSSINMGIFSKYAHYLRRDFATLGTALVVATILAGVYFLTGILLAWKRPVADQISTIIGLVLLNNTLVVVFSSQFFGPIEPIVNTVYMVPFFGLVVPLRAYQKFRLRG